jgi:hypothetical protein
MLDDGNAEQVIDEFWRKTSRTVVLPPEIAEHYAQSGKTASMFDDRRAFMRFHLRGRAILCAGGEYFGVYTKDISRNAFGFYHCEQLFPCDEVQIWLPTGIQRRLVIRRCRRIADGCFECGAEIVVPKESAEPAACQPVQ